MFDVFYKGKAPELFAHEREVDSVEQAQKLSRTRYFWFINYLCMYPEDWDFLWEPPPWQSEFRHAWPSQHQRDAETYLIPKNGFTETVYHSSPTFMRTFNHTKNNWFEIPTNIAMHNWDYSWHPDPADPPMIHEFGTQWQETGGPRYVPDHSEPESLPVKIHNTPRAVASLPVPNAWEVPVGISYRDFDYTWHPDRRDPPYIYQFGTQHQRTGGPRFVVPGARDVKYVDQVKITADRVAQGVVIIDHLDGNVDIIEEQLKDHNIPILKRVRFFDNYLDTLRRISRTIDAEYVWIVSSVCEYHDFDFSWHPEQWQAHMLHVFPSNEQKFGDTFFMHIPTFEERSEHVQLLEWYDVNFVKERTVERRSPVYIYHNDDSQVSAVLNTDWVGPLAVFEIGDQGKLIFDNIGAHGAHDIVPATNLWRQETRTIDVLSPDGSVVVVPKNAVGYITEQIYDYPEISRKHFDSYTSQPPLDIVFISNGESNADKNWEHLCKCTQDIPNRVVRVDGVNGRVQAYQRALEASNTPWAFCVFAKLEVTPGFDWSWQPDRLQQPKHYIFNAYNPVTGLEYGHMAMIAYNKNLVMQNTATGLDFTLDQAHEVVPVLSGTADYAHDAWIAWRSAFRECIKLYHSLPDIDNEWRLQQWLKNNLLGTQVGEWSRRGAEDAIEYYDSVQGSFEALRLTYEWDWLATYIKQKHNITVTELSNIRL